MPRFEVMAAVAGAAASIGIAGANAADAKSANNKAGKLQMEQNWQNQRVAQDIQAQNNALYQGAGNQAQGYIQSAGNQAQGYQNQYLNQGGAGMSALTNAMGVGGINSQAQADQINAQNEAAYQQQLAAYNQAGIVDTSGYDKQLADYQAQQKKVQDTKNWYNTFGRAHGVSEQQAMQMGGINQSMMDAQAPTAPTPVQRGAAPTQQEKVTYNPGANKDSGYGALNTPYDAAQYQKDPTYTPLVSNTLSADEYAKTPGYTPLVSNTLTPEEYKNSIGYTAIPTTLEELQATPGYKFQLEQGLQGIDNSAAARGMSLSGATMKAANNYAQGQASTGFADAWNRGQQAYKNALANKMNQYGQGQTAYQNALANKMNQYGQGQDAYQRSFDNKMTQYGQGQTAYNKARGNSQDQQQQQYDRLFGLAGMGQNAAGTSSNIATNAGSNLANNVTNTANNMAGNNTAMAGIYTNSGQNAANQRGNVAIGNSLAGQNMSNQIGNSLTNLAGQYLTYNSGSGGSLFGRNGAGAGNGTGSLYGAPLPTNQPYTPWQGMRTQ